MSNAARKARKAAGIQFQHPVKTPTPLRQRARFEFLPPKYVATELVLRGETFAAAHAAGEHVAAAWKSRRVQRRLAGRR
ncbi:hypothetical protein [Leifsonia sp. NPDC058248]|uniref:hypothetical protein n=1 Tax=Leifsonia sp. NPDC058248 TaxID=3346402 RepID=UPI0036DE3A4C